ncbi:hypothetical protein U9M48_034814 [Paspalum notatum var. saurae]|uniref:Uncharacterized protein n=1 Tax=Paspalum notatum var. saurae TaxID=547442 RepID=A0AAQ3UE72_PASNO
MACTAIQQQRLRRPTPSGGGGRLFFPAVPVLLLLVLLLAVSARPASCSRPLPLDGSNSGGIGAKAAADNVVILLPLPTWTAAAGAAAPAAPPPTTTTFVRPTGDKEDQGHRLAGRHQWLLSRKPRGKPPPSAPSKRTN